jgi:hypothetical protein
LLGFCEWTEDFLGDISTACLDEEEEYDGDEEHSDEHGKDTGEQEAGHRIPVVSDPLPGASEPKI